MRRPGFWHAHAGKRWAAAAVRAAAAALALGPASLVTASSSAAADPLHVLAVHPYLPQGELLSRFRPLADHLSRRTGLRFEVRVGRDYGEHIDHVGTDRVDLAFMGPASYVALTNRHGPKPLLGKLEINGAPWLSGSIVVRQDSPIRSVSELRGKRFAFGDPQSTMSHLVPRAVLEQANVTPSNLSAYEFLGSHENVALGVLSGHFDAGAVKDETLAKYRGRGLTQLAALPPVAEHVFVARAGLPPETVATLRAALLELRNSKGGREILRRIRPEATGIVAAEDRDYADLRRLLAQLKEVPGQ